MNKVLIIGCGHMGSALLNAWKDLNLYKFTIIDPYNYQNLKRKFNSRKVNFCKSIIDLKNISEFNIIIFAIKPQVLKNVIKEYKNLEFKKTSVLISIIAGKKINFFKNNLNNINQIIRVMPNMPALANKGISCLVSNKFVSNSNKSKVNFLFSKVGKTIWMKSEKEIDMATAISGSGPGYVFTILDAMEKATTQLGFSSNVAKNLVVETFLGSILLLLKTKRSSKDLAEHIAIKGGTTEAGIKILKKNKIDKIINQTIDAAYKRASFLGKSDK